MRMLVIASLLCALTSVQATASPATPESRVSYADLDLRSEAGIRTLDQRLKRAVKSACSQDDRALDLREQMAARRCVAKISSGIAQPRNDAIARKGMHAALLR